MNAQDSDYGPTPAKAHAINFRRYHPHCPVRCIRTHGKRFERDPEALVRDVESVPLAE